MAAIETGFHEYHIACESVEAGRERCAECGDLGPKDLLFRYSSVRGRKVREHGGLFCSLSCHDVYYGLCLPAAGRSVR